MKNSSAECDGGAVIRNFIHRHIRALHVATKFVGCDALGGWMWDGLLDVMHFFKKDGFKSD